MIRTYPIYLVHIMVWYFFEPRVLIVACIAASALLVLLVERPLEQWRERRPRCWHHEVRDSIGQCAIFRGQRSAE